MHDDEATTKGSSRKKVIAERTEGSRSRFLLVSREIGLIYSEMTLVTFCHVYSGKIETHIGTSKCRIWNTHGTDGMGSVAAGSATRLLPQGRVYWDYLFSIYGITLTTDVINLS